MSFPTYTARMFHFLQSIVVFLTPEGCLFSIPNDYGMMPDSGRRVLEPLDRQVCAQFEPNKRIHDLLSTSNKLDLRSCHDQFEHAHLVEIQDLIDSQASGPNILDSSAVDAGSVETDN